MSVRRLARLVAMALVLTLAAGCTYYPTIRDTGSPRIETRNGRLVRVDGGAICYLELANTGMFEDTLIAAESRSARRVEIVTGRGQPAALIKVLPETRVSFDADGFRIVLSELTQPMVPGDGVIVTLIFEKSGRIGVVSVVE